jgi:hypothetical protein
LIKKGALYKSAFHLGIIARFITDTNVDAESIGQFIESGFGKIVEVSTNA